MVTGDAAGNTRLLDVRIGVSRVEIVDVSPELILKLRSLAPSEKIGLIESDEPADSSALTRVTREA